MRVLRRLPKATAELWRYLAVPCGETVGALRYFVTEFIARRRNPDQMKADLLAHSAALRALREGTHDDRRDTNRDAKSGPQR
jgi:hypothetical protein